MLPVLLLAHLAVADDTTEDTNEDTTEVASEYITEIGPEVHLQSSGTWLRTFHQMESGVWWAAYATNGEYHISPLRKLSSDLDAWDLAREEQFPVTDRGGILKDHAIRVCPDGSYLHIGSANLSSDNDSAYATLLNDDFTVRATAVIEEHAEGTAHNDMTAICTDEVRGVIFPTGTDAGHVFFEIGDDAKPTDNYPVWDAPNMAGGAMVVDPLYQELVLVGIEDGSALLVTTYEGDWDTTNTLEIPLGGNDLRPYWPQGLLRVGTHWMGAVMALDEGLEENGGSGGDIHLFVFDDDWNVVESHALTNYEYGEGALRPWLSRSGDQVLVTWDAAQEHTLMEIKVNSERMGLSDDVSSDIDNPVDGGAAGGSAAPWVGQDNGCGANEPTGGPAFALVLPLWMVARGRRRSEARARSWLRSLKPMSWTDSRWWFGVAGASCMVCWWLIAG